MQTDTHILFIEINVHEYVFVVGENSEDENFRLIYKNSTSAKGISNNQISDLNEIFEIFKKNIILIEQKLNIVFKDFILILNNFEYSTVNISGYKKLNGSQLAKENITYIINSLKSEITKTENEKTILHIFNTKYNLDKKNIQNLPLGLFGTFYSQELSFFLINSNDYKNLKNIFNKCNLKIKKIISKNFIKGVKLINDNAELETFIKIEINDNSTELIYFEDSALKFSQRFDFGTQLIIKDISKIIALDIENVKKILLNSNFSKENISNDFIEKNFFYKKKFRKIKKQLIFDIAKARIHEIAELVLIKNINLKSFIKNNLDIFLKINDLTNLKCFETSYILAFSNENKLKVNLTENILIEEIYKSANNLVQYGWKKEAVPIVNEKKSFIATIFDLIFN
tara:strand:+ start:1083 stop:2279 length:1197 start_codon:yes stop_codon:yes gene_type:complete